MPAIHLDPLRLRVVPPDDPVHEVLQVIQAVAILADQHFTLAGMNLQARSVFGLLDLDRRREAQMPEHGVENLGR